MFLSVTYLVYVVPVYLGEKWFCCDRENRFFFAPLIWFFPKYEQENQKTQINLFDWKEKETNDLWLSHINESCLKLCFANSVLYKSSAGAS